MVKELKFWTLMTPYGEIKCRKGRSYGERVWRQPESEKTYKTAFFDADGNRLYRDVYAHVNKQWVPSRGNEKYTGRMSYEDWESKGKPKTLEGKKIGIVVRKIMEQGTTSKAVSGSQDLTFKVATEVEIQSYELKRFVSSDAKYIIPLPESKHKYMQVADELSSKSTMLITNPVQISTNSAVRYIYGVISFKGFLLMVELLSDDLQRPFPPDAMIPGEDNAEVGELVEEGDEELI